MPRLFLVAGVFGEPIEVVGGAPFNRHGDDFGNVVAVEAFDFSFEGRKLFFHGFDEEQLLTGGLDLPFPSVNGLNGAKNDGYAGREMFANHFAGDAAGFDKVSACDQNDASGFCTSHELLRKLKAGYKTSKTQISKGLSLRRTWV